MGLVFRRPPFIKVPEASSAIGKALADFNNDADMVGSPLAVYAKKVVREIMAVGRAGTLVNWEDENEPQLLEDGIAAGIALLAHLLEDLLRRIGITPKRS